MLSEEQKRKARELAKQKFEEKQQAEKLKAEQEKAQLDMPPLPQESTPIPEKSPKEKSEVGKRGLTDKQKALAAQTEANFSKAEEYYEKAVSKYMRPDLDEALLHLRSALALHPSNSKYHYNIAYIYSLKDQDEICLNHYKAFLRYAPATDPDIKNVEGRVQYYEKKIREALELKRHQNRPPKFLK